MAKDRTKYIFNGNTYGKGRLVLAVVEQYVSENPGLGKEELEEIFPATLQGTTGVVSSIEEAEGKYKGKRHFVKNAIRLTNATMAVCSQWGADNLEGFLQHATGELGYAINEESGAEDLPSSSSDVVDMDVIGDEYVSTSLISDEQAESLFADIEDHYNNKAPWASLVSSCGGNLQWVSFDIQKDPSEEDPDIWLFVAVLTAAESFDLSDDARTQILDDLESIADDLYDLFESAGFDPQDMSDYKIEMVDEDDVITDVTKSNS